MSPHFEYSDSSILGSSRKKGGAVLISQAAKGHLAGGRRGGTEEGRLLKTQCLGWKCIYLSDVRDVKEAAEVAGMLIFASSIITAT